MPLSSFLEGGGTGWTMHAADFAWTNGASCFPERRRAGFRLGGDGDGLKAAACFGATFGR
jgi:hypothetical protein